MLAEIITIGDEILIGQIVDTNSAYISKELNNIGVQVYQITSIQDERIHILNALKEAQSRADIVIVTGGLGPTKDDITKQTFCEFFDDTLIENPQVLEHVRNIFEKRLKLAVLPSNLSQAMVPSQATVLPNQFGTAPGMWFEKGDKVFISMPGVPFEMKHLIQNEVLPRLIERFKMPFIYHKTLLTHGLGESAIAHRIEAWEDALPEAVKLAYLPSFGRVRLRLSSKGFDEDNLKGEIDSKMKQLSGMLQDIALGYEEEASVEQQLGMLLVEQGKTLCTAESFTGGTIASRITENAGSSAYFRGGIVPYHQEIKSGVLGVDSEIIAKYTVVSGQVAEAMAVNVRSLFKTDYAIATTGVAGPSTGETNHEVGTAFIAVASPAGVTSQGFNFGKSRERVIAKGVHKAIEMLHKEILKN